MKKWQFWLGVLVSIVFIWLALRGLRLEEFWDSVKQANYIWLIPGIGVYFIGVWVRAWRWQMLREHTDMMHETFWRQLAQALTASVPEPVTLSTERVYYGDESSVTFRADVRDQEYAPATDATVSLQVDFPGGAVETLTMEAVPGVPGRYESTVDAAPTGIYRVVAEATMAAEPTAGETTADGTTPVAAAPERESLGRSRLAIRREDGISEHFQVQQVK